MSDDFIVDGKAISELRVVDLKTQLEKRGLSKSGSKNVLAKRLRDHLSLEKIQEEQAHKDPNSAPNMEMKSCGSNIVAEYLERQQQALQAAKKAAQAVRAASSSSFDEPDVSPNNSMTDLSQKVELSPKLSGQNNGNEKEVHTSSAAVDETETPLNLSKGETEPTGPAAKMEEEQHAAAKMEKVKRGKMTIDQPVEDVARPMEEEPVESKTMEGEPVEASPKRSESSASSDHVRPRSRSPSSDENVEKSTKRENHVERSPSADAESRQHGEDAEELEISAPHNAAEELEVVASQIMEQVKTNGSVVLDKSSVEPEEAVGEKPTRKRRWGATTLNKRATASVSISSESLKDIVGPVSASDSTTLDDPVQLDYDEEPVTKRIVISREDMDEEDTTEATPDMQTTVNHERAAVTGVVEPTVDDDGLIRERSASPARHEVSQIVHIRCLTRPFTGKQLNDLLSKFGSFGKEDFWIDGIKSHCFVKYNSTEEASNARVKLHNAKWPASNPQVLRVDFSTQDEFDRHRNPSSKEQPMSSRENNFDVSKPRERVVREIRVDDDSGSRKRTVERSDSKEIDAKLWPKNREWDQGKEWNSGQSPPPSEKNERSDRIRSMSPIRRDKKEEVPAKLLDGLFRKTKTTPCIYWLPLTLDQVIAKEMERKKRQLERAERVKQMEQEPRDDRRRYDRDHRRDERHRR